MAFVEYEDDQNQFYCTYFVVFMIINVEINMLL